MAGMGPQRARCQGLDAPESVCAQTRRGPKPLDLPGNHKPRYTGCTKSMRRLLLLAMLLVGSFAKPVRAQVFFDESLTQAVSATARCVQP
jgi:hypothetical protein